MTALQHAVSQYEQSLAAWQVVHYTDDGHPECRGIAEFMSDKFKSMWHPHLLQPGNFEQTTEVGHLNLKLPVAPLLLPVATRPTRGHRRDCQPEWTT